MVDSDNDKTEEVRTRLEEGDTGSETRDSSDDAVLTLDSDTDVSDVQGDGAGDDEGTDGGR